MSFVPPAVAQKRVELEVVERFSLFDRVAGRGGATQEEVVPLLLIDLNLGDGRKVFFFAAPLLIESELAAFDDRERFFVFVARLRVVVVPAVEARAQRGSVEEDRRGQIETVASSKFGEPLGERP